MMEAVRTQVSVYDVKEKVNADSLNVPANAPSLQVSAIPSPPPPPPPAPRIMTDWEQNNPARRPVIGPLLVGVPPVANNRNISAPQPVTEVSKTEWSEREHLHNLVNTLTIENVDLKSQRHAKEKLIEGLERQLKTLETQNGRLKQQIGSTSTTAVNDQSVKEVTSLTSTLTIKPAALEWPGTELFQGISSNSDTKRSTTLKNVHLLSGPGIFLQLTGNPWRKIQESQALDDLTMAIIHALNVKQSSKTITDEEEENGGAKKRKANHAFAFFDEQTYLTGSSSFYATDTPDQYRLPIRQIEFERITSLLRAATKNPKQRPSNDIGTQVNDSEYGIIRPLSKHTMNCANKMSSTIQLNKINKVTTVDKTMICPPDQSTSVTIADTMSNQTTAELRDWNKWVQISIGIIVHMFFVRLMELLF